MLLVVAEEADDPDDDVVVAVEMSLKLFVRRTSHQFSVLFSGSRTRPQQGRALAPHLADYNSTKRRAPTGRRGEKTRFENVCVLRGSLFHVTTTTTTGRGVTLLPKQSQVHTCFYSPHGDRCPLGLHCHHLLLLHDDRLSGTGHWTSQRVSEYHSSV